MRGRYALIGTTEVDYQGDPGEARITRAEILYLRDAVSRYFRHALNPRSGAVDVRRRAAAVRRRQGQSVRGDPRLRVRSGPCGGRGAAPVDLRRQGHHLPQARGARPGEAATGAGFDGRPWTATAPLPGGDLPHGDFEEFVRRLRTAAPWLPADLARRYARGYGSRVDKLLAGARSLGDLGEHLGGGLYEAELEYLRRHEWAVTATDVLWRRSKLGLHVGDDTIARVEAWLGQSAKEASAALAE